MGTTGTVVGCSALIASISAIKDTTHGKSPMQPVVTGFMLAFALLLVALVSQALARALALMGVLGAILVNGQGVLSTLGKVGA